MTSISVKHPRKSFVLLNNTVFASLLYTEIEAGLLGFPSPRCPAVKWEIYGNSITVKMVPWSKSSHHDRRHSQFSTVHIYMLAN